MTREHRQVVCERIHPLLMGNRRPVFRQHNGANEPRAVRVQRRVGSIRVLARRS